MRYDKKKVKMAKYLNKGFLSGVLTILTGITGVLAATGVAVPAALLTAISAIGALAGVITTKDSADLR